MNFARSLLGCLPLLIAPCLAAAEPDKPAPVPEKVSYHRDVRPIFQQHCQGCHQPAKPMGGFLMMTRDDLLKPGDQEKPAVVPGDPGKSFLVELITPDKDGKAEMPKGRDPLTDRERRLITDWIAQGAADDTPESAKTARIDMDHPPVYRLPPVISAIDISPDGKYLAVSGYHEVLIHHADGSGLVSRLVGLSERIQAVAFSPDGKELAVAGGSPGRFGEVQIWDVGRERLKLSLPVTFDTVYGVSWSHDGTKVAFGCGDNTLRAINAEDGTQVLYQGAHGDWVLDTVFSRESDFLVSVSRDMSMKLTEVATQRFIDNVTSITPGALKGGLATVARRPIAERKMAKVPDDTPDAPAKVYDELLTGGSDGVPRLYKMHRETKRVIGDDANRIREYEAMPGRVFAVDFNADGSRFVAGSSLGTTGEVRVYETDSGKLLARCEQVPAGVYAAAFHPDGKVVVSGGFDGTVRLHDAETGKLIKAFVPVPLEK
ncbi:MAG TPA: c-type cytochrome domain-containing protein [Gemmataceae bacterium]